MEVVGIVEGGVVKLPAEAHLPEGTRVRIVWQPDTSLPLEREALDEDAVEQDLRWATGTRFPV